MFSIYCLLANPHRHAEISMEYKPLWYGCVNYNGHLIQKVIGGDLNDQFLLHLELSYLRVSCLSSLRQAQCVKDQNSHIKKKKHVELHWGVQQVNKDFLKRSAQPSHKQCNWVKTPTNATWIRTTQLKLYSSILILRIIHLLSVSVSLPSIWGKKPEVSNCLTSDYTEKWQ